MNELVQTERRGHVLVVSMQREQKRNAVDRALADAIDAALNELEDDDDLWVGILTGTATVFCAGSDLGSRGDYVTARGGEYGVIRRPRRKPLIAAVEGFALGGGFEIVLACDLIVASSAARFGLPEVCRGLVPTCGALFRAPNVLPVNLAREMTLTGVPVPAERLHQAGVVSLVTEPGGALAGAIGMAEQICTNAPLAVQACLTAIGELVDQHNDDGWARTEAAQRAIAGSHDQQEGVRAFFDKRPPVWTGH
ncbi:MAG: Enoyl-CoA hydratase/isomerase [Ilumatobacteraceae bacterium]|nr:Enoyl-CoA hydratase/isomerase [Ilumatobacteraceae bacterium]